MIEIEDNTGKLVSLQDIDDAIAACSAAVTRITTVMGNPQLAVNLPNILRCLQELKAIRQNLSGLFPKEDP
jgi:hypothetical protein